ncbi:SLAP domain-containing protein [Lactobacillus helveticus]|uniref:SLAP domain-containing protein n=1 Tax=Lactobacillus TaxID=1578 RepID=UPI0015626A7C|nr:MULTISPECIES: SLAP domain-containing protein [Lactobacillus]MCO0807859.1 SLAP domain-containing protein [Lactobacillus helveticus]MCP9318035.1 SLAP domain-containing protein [Lactobacillus helveticus]MDH5818445.1 SLAP domain-containing protein [Lactobacillus helveticus]MDN5956227.1 SLAP domain-containing protein [Lactobacillus sp.]MDN6009113.1 SLAP domain-containing protein [Lactobacillus sp.]
MMRKQIISAAGIMLAVIGLGAATTQSVDATVTNPVRQGKRLNLTRNATVYNRHGVKVGHLRKGKLYKVRAIKVINGNTYVKIRKNRFVKEEAFLPYMKSTVKVVNRIKKHSFVYDENGEKIPGKFLKRGAKVNYLGHKEINEKPFIKIADGEYVKALNALTTVTNH